MRLLPFAARVAALTLVAGAALPAQSDKAKDKNKDDASRGRREVTIYRSDDDDSGFRFFGPDDESSSRPVLGVSTSSGGERDTLGLLITGVTTGGPADRAGLAEGDRIAAVNGVNLRLAPADAGEPDMQGLVTRRLTRELAKAKPGDQVELRVWQNGQFRSVRLRPVAADSLPGRRTAVRFTRDEWARRRDDRAVLGIDLQPSGSRRDTLGVLVTRVADGGPAERAGLVEGDRVASVNGVDLRVPREDAGDGWVSNAKSNRFSRELERLKPGDAVELRVYSAGQYKSVRVTAGRAGDVYKEGRNTFFMRNAFMDGDLIAPPAPVLAPVPPAPPAPPAPPRGFDDYDFRFALPAVELHVNGPEIQRRVDDAMRRASAAVARSGAAFQAMRLAGPRGVYRI